MDAGKVLIHGIFNRGRELVIPFYQRTYVWGEEQWGRLLEDLEFVTESCHTYFLGTIILKQAKTFSGESVSDRRIVIDGQQRLTTIVLFFKAYYILSGKNDDFIYDFMQKDKKTPSLRLGLNDKDAFEAICSFEEKKYASGNSQIEKAYNYFLDHIDLSKVDENTIKQNLQLVSIDIDTNEDEQKIFDTINSLGVRLTTAELLKNYFYSKDDLDLYKSTWVETFEKDEDTKKYWDSECSSGSKKRAMIDMFFSAYFQLFVENPVYSVSAEDKVYYSRIDSLFSSYKEFISKYCNNNKNVILDGLFKSAKLFRELFNPELLNDTCPSTFGKERINVLIFGMDNTTIMPYILYFEQQNSDKEDKSKMYRLIESFFVKRMVTKQSNKNYNKQFMYYARRGVCTSQQLEFELQKPNEFGMGIPTDKELLEGFKTSKLANKQTKGILYLLETALFKDGSAVMPLGFNSYSLEHLMPKKWRNHWGSLNDEEAAQRDSALLTLGNLTIIPQKLNTAIMDSEWQIKKAGKKGKLGLEKCAKGLAIMENVLEKDVWDEKAIEERSKWLCDRANEIWNLRKLENNRKNSDSGGSAGELGKNKTFKVYDSSQFSFSSKPISDSKQVIVNKISTFSNESIVSRQCPFHKDYQGLDIDFLKCLDIKPSDIRKLKDAGINTLDEIIDKREIITQVIHNWDDKSKALNQLKMSAVTLYCKMIDYDDSNDNPDLSKVIRRFMGDTLEMIGQDTGITRERVRQIVDKYLDRKEPLINLIVSKIIKNNIVSNEQIYESVRSQKPYEVMICYLSNSDDYESLPSCIWFIKKNGLLSINNLNNIINEYVKDFVTIKDDYEELIEMLNEKGYACIDSSNIEDTLLELGYRICGHTVSNRKLSYDKMCALAVRDIFPDGMDIYDDESVQNLVEYVEKEFKTVPRSTTTRSISAHLDRVLVQCGRGKGIHPDGIVIDYSIVEQMLEFIDRNDKNDIYFNEIYEVFKNKLRESGSNVDNQYFVHGVINYYAPGRYDTKRDYLIKDSSKVREPIVDRLDRFIHDKGRPVKRDEILSGLGITNPTLSLALAQSKDVFLWDINEFFCYSLLNITDISIDYFIDKILDLAGGKGITSTNLLYKEIETEKPGYMALCGIMNQNNFHYVLVGLLINDDRFALYKPLIFTDYYKGPKTEGIYRYLLNSSSIVKYNDFLNEMNALYVPRGSADVIFGELVKDWYYDGKVYIKPGHLAITESELCAIDSWALNKTVDGLLAERYVNDFIGLPNINHAWSYELLMSILGKKSNVFNVIKTTTVAKQSTKMHAVVKESKVTTFAESVRKIIADKGVVSISQSEIHMYLRDRGMINNTLPAELYDAECLQYKDGYFVIA